MKSSKRNSKLQGCSLCGNSHFFTVILNGEAIKLEIPVEIYKDYKEEAQEWVESHPMTLNIKGHINEVNFNSEELEYSAGNLLRFLAEPLMQGKSRPSFYEMKDIVSYAYGICCHNRGLRPLKVFFNAYNNKCIKTWLRIIPTIDLW